jgi:formate/nitrite transporter FocA (FNT family)
MRKPIRIAVLAGTAGVIVAAGTAAALAVQGEHHGVTAGTPASLVGAPHRCDPPRPGVW